MVVCAIGLALAVITVFVIPNFAPLFKILGNDIPGRPASSSVPRVVRHNGIALVAASAIAFFALRRHVAPRPAAISGTASN